VHFGLIERARHWLSEDAAESPLLLTSRSTGFNAPPYFTLAHPSAEKAVNAATPVIQTHHDLGAIVIEKAYDFFHL